MVLKFRIRSPAISPNSRAIFVKYSNGLSFSGPSDQRLSPSDGPGGNFLPVTRNIYSCYSLVGIASTRRADALNPLSRATRGFESRRDRNRLSHLKIQR